MLNLYSGLPTRSRGSKHRRCSRAGQGRAGAVRAPEAVRGLPVPTCHRAQPPPGSKTGAAPQGYTPGCPAPVCACVWARALGRAGHHADRRRAPAHSRGTAPHGSDAAGTSSRRNYSRDLCVSRGVLRHAKRLLLARPLRHARRNRRIPPRSPPPPSGEFCARAARQIVPAPPARPRPARLRAPSSAPALPPRCPLPGSSRLAPGRRRCGGGQGTAERYAEGGSPERRRSAAQRSA